MFAVEANNNEMANGFYVNICSVHDGDDFTGLGLSQYDSKEEKGKTPFSTVMIVPLILPVVALDPSSATRLYAAF